MNLVLKLSQANLNWSILQSPCLFSFSTPNDEKFTSPEDSHRAQVSGPCIRRWTHVMEGADFVSFISVFRYAVSEIARFIVRIRLLISGMSKPWSHFTRQFLSSEIWRHVGLHAESGEGNDVVQRGSIGHMAATLAQLAYCTHVQDSAEYHRWWMTRRLTLISITTTKPALSSLLVFG